MITKHPLIALIAALLVVGLMVTAFQTQAIPVDTVQAHYAAMKVTVDEEGKTRVIDRFIIHAPIDAFMRRIDLDEGASVKRGETLSTLQPLPSPLLDPRNRAQAEATLGAAKELENIIKEVSEAAKADRELADITFQRTTKLRKKKVVSVDEMDIAESEKQRSNALYRATQFGSVFSRFLTQMSRSALDYEDLRPIGSDNRTVNLISNSNGTILKLADKSERIVRAGDVLMEIGNIEQIEVEAEVLSTVAVQLKPGMPVELLRWGGEQLLHGTIDRIEPAGFTKISALGVEEQRVKVIIAITTELTDHQRLGDGFRVEARFILWQSDRALQIPNSALFRDNNEQRGWAVYLIKGDRLEKRAVKIGHRNSLMAEVIEGLDENESVVAYLSNELKEGVKVEIR